MNAASNDMAVVMAKLESMDRWITNMDQFIDAIHVGCDNCSGPHLTKDCDLDENGNQKAQVCYSNGDRYDEDWRKPKKVCLPYKEYKKAKEEKFKRKARGCYQKEEPVPEKKTNLEATLTHFGAALEKKA